MCSVNSLCQSSVSVDLAVYTVPVSSRQTTCCVCMSAMHNVQAEHACMCIVCMSVCIVCACVLWYVYYAVSWLV